MKTIIPLILLFAISLYLYKIDKEEEAPQYEPQDSELALLMRKIHDDAKGMRASLVHEETVLIYDPSIEFIVNATPTRAEVQGPEFEAFARYYIEKTQKAVEKGSFKDYNLMVEACVACHQEFCPGPIKTINKLKIKTASSSQ